MKRPSSTVLMEELVEEVLLRFPLAEPASLVRAALVCKPWCRLISGRRFHRRFREFHRSPPMLGYFCNLRPKDTGDVSRFFPASPACPPHADQVHRSVLDARHGRVLLHSFDRSPHRLRRRLQLTVWDPITGERWELPQLSYAWDKDNYWNAAVLCAARGGGACDHLDCRGKPFLVVFAGSKGTEVVFLWTYSSETGSWSEPTFAALELEYGVSDLVPPALVGNSLYFVISMCFDILRYDLVTREVSMIENEAAYSMNDASGPMAIDDSGMAVWAEKYSRLFLCSMETSPKGDISWKKIRVIELNELLPVKVRPICADYFAFVPGFGIIVATSRRRRLYSFDLKSDKVEVVCEGPLMKRIVPYRSFYVPALGSFAAVEGPGADADASS